MKTNISLVILCCISTTVCAGISDYISSVATYFGIQRENENDVEELYNQKIPYEVSTIDENFLAEAATLTGVALSELDSCQQRVVLKLQSDCERMNDEQLAKLAVHLLNCQSYVEGRQTYPCTDEMSIKDCTTSMDSDTWTSYHIMSNRARAVCYTIRQSQFRGLAAHTVNRLMDAAKDQLRTLGKISNAQQNLKNIAEFTYESLNEGQKHLSQQQKDLQSAQFHGQLAVEDNIKRLIDEKRLISETHKQLIEMTKNMQDKLGDSFLQLDHHSHESKLNHKELIEDVMEIQEKVQEVFKKIEESSSMLLEQNKNFKTQYELTLRNLQEVNNTVHGLISLVGGTQKMLEERLTWITTALGGTDLAVERLYLILWHSAFMFTAMLTCAFLGVRASTRLVVACLPPLNLAMALYGEYYLDPMLLGSAIGGFIVVQTILLSVVALKSGTKRETLRIKENGELIKDPHINQSPKESINGNATEVSSSYAFNKSSNLMNENDDGDYANELKDDYKGYFHSLTPPVSRNGHYSVRSRSRSSTPLHINTSLKGSCHAKTRMGTPCKLTSLPGRDFCYRHQTGDSVMC